MIELLFEDKLIEAFKTSRIDVILTNPCARIRHLLMYFESNPDFETIQLTREDYGIGIAAGVSLAGKKAILFIQSTGLGNLLNSLASLTLTYDLPLAIFCSWRGVIDEPIEAQKRFGHAIEGIMEALDVKLHKILVDKDISIIQENLRVVYEKNSVHVFLLSPRLWDMNWKGEVRYLRKKHTLREQKVLFSSQEKIELTRYQAINAIVRLASDTDIIIANIGLPSKELYAIKDRPGNFYMTGSLGQASAIGLGLAKYTKNRVIVIDGDGSVLMSLGLLPMIAQYGTKNLVIICLDNGSYGSTGDQPTLTALGLDLFKVVSSVGIPEVAKITGKDELELVFHSKQECVFVLFKITPGNASVAPIPISNNKIATRFRSWLEGHRA